MPTKLRKHIIKKIIIFIPGSNKYMHKIIKKLPLAENLKEFVIDYPLLAQKAKAGQFVIVRLRENGERIPLTLADFDVEKGTITLVVQEIGKTTIEFGQMQEGDFIQDILGPLGHPSEIKNFGTVLMIAGGVGIAPLFPILKSLKNADNKTITILGAKNKDLLFWQDKLAYFSDEFYVCTDDGSAGEKGLVTNIQEKLINSRQIDKIYAIGPAIMMKVVVDTARQKNISTIVSLNSIMIDGTGMCGGCRVMVKNEPKFVCVDGPEFEGLDVDFVNLMNRQRFYLAEEKTAKEHTCKIGLDK